MLLTCAFVTVVPSEASVAQALPQLWVTLAATIGRIAVHLSAEVWQAINTYTVNASTDQLAKKVIDTKQLMPPTGWQAGVS